MNVFERILDYRSLAALAKQEPDGWVIPLHTEDAIHGGQVEVQLAAIMRSFA